MTKNSLLKQVFAHEVYPALGCTEPISCAYAATVAAHHLGQPVECFRLVTDPGTLKNGRSVTVPRSGSRMGNEIAAAMGAIVARPEAKLEVLQDVTPEVLEKAVALIESEHCESDCNEGADGFFVEVTVRGGGHRASCVISGGHTNITRIELDDKILVDTEHGIGQCTDIAASDAMEYRSQLQQMSLLELVDLAEQIDDEDRELVRRGVTMNLAAAEAGDEIKGSAFQLHRMQERGFLSGDLFFRTKITVAAAVDARMAGYNLPVMTSGGSGNQGIVGILTPWIVSEEMGIDDETRLRGLALSHLINSYVKSFLGELSVTCGCAMAAGIAAAVSIVYMRLGRDERRLQFAVSNVIGDLGGFICDGAKPGCALKAISAVDTAMRSALMAIDDYGIHDDGLVGTSAEESIKNLGRLALEGMFQVDPTVLEILRQKNLSSGSA